MTKKKATSKLHYFPWYYEAWLSASNVTIMTYDEKGLYTDMISRCYKDNGLPNDEESLQRLFNGCSTTALTTVQRMFYVDGNDRLQHEKLDKIKKDQGVMIKNASNAGKASAAKRKERKIKELSNATAVEIPLNEKATNRTEQNKAKHSKKNITKKDRLSAFTQSVLEINSKEKILTSASEINFVDYWTESNPGENTKLKFETNKIFDIAKRLRTWANNDFGKTDKAVKKTSYNAGGADGEFATPPKEPDHEPATAEEIAQAIKEF